MQGKHILIGVTGGIAAYKTAYLIRDLVKRGAEVKVIMTEKAKAFITPLTLATLSRNPILVDFFDPTNGAWNSHVSLGLWADAYIIAPATANTIAKMAHGVADNLLTTTYLSARCPIFVAPAMDLDMYAHPTPTEFDREDIFLSHQEMETKRLCEFILSQEPVITPYSKMTGYFNMDGSIVGDAFRRMGHKFYAELKKEFYLKSVDNLSTQEWQHATADYTKVLKKGIGGIIAEIDESAKIHTSMEELAFLKNQLKFFNEN